MKVMISQPMAGKNDDSILKTRDKIIEKFDKLHIDVIPSLFETDAPSESYNPAVFYLGRTIVECLHQVDAVYFADGWEKARGCRIEHQICQEYGIKCLYSDFFETGNKPQVTSIRICNSDTITATRDTNPYSVTI